MTWDKIEKKANRKPPNERRSVPCVSRSPSRPDAAYMMLPREMADGKRVSIYHDGGWRIALQFGTEGEYVVRPTSTTSYTVRVTIPRSLLSLIPFGLHEIAPDRDPEGRLVFDFGGLGRQLMA